MLSIVVESTVGEVMVEEAVMVGVLVLKALKEAKDRGRGGRWRASFAECDMMAAWWELVVSEAMSPDPNFVTGLEVNLPLVEVMTGEIGLMILWPRHFSLEAPFIRISGVLAGRIDEGEGKSTASGLELPTVNSCTEDTIAVEIGGIGDGAGEDLTDEESTGDEGAEEVTQEEKEQEFTDVTSTVVVVVVDRGKGAWESLSNMTSIAMADGDIEEVGEDFDDEKSPAVVFGNIVEAGEGLVESLEVSLM
jgi:hypothetical protein